MRFLRFILKTAAAAVGLVCLLGGLVLFLGGASMELLGASVAIGGEVKYPQWSSLLILPAGLVPLFMGYLLFGLAKDMYHVIKGSI
jgi:hypothetical protein